MARKYLARFLSILFSITFFIPLSESVVAKGEEASVVKQMIQSEGLTLALDAQVKTPMKGENVSIYQSAFATIDKKAFQKLVFGSGVKVGEELKKRTAQELKEWQIRFPEHELYFDARIKGKPISTRYDVNLCALHVRFDDYDRLVNWYDALPNQLGSYPASKEQADHFIDGLADLGWNNLLYQDVFLIPGTGKSDKNSKGGPFQIVAYRRVIDGIPVAADALFPDGPNSFSIDEPDEMLIMTDEEGVFRIEGNYRFYQAVRKEKISISLDDALRILEKNVEGSRFVKAGAKREAAIKQIEFCYRLKPLLPPGHEDYKIELETRPAWRFATKTNRYMDEEFVMFIDAVSGEVIE